jgi:prephenate dehydrogenase
MGALSASATSVEEAATKADLVIVAAPVGQLPRMVAEVLRSCANATVTDVGSTKIAVCAAAEQSDRFIGGHPMAGGETRGPEGARADLFDGAKWFLTPSTKTATERYRLVHGFVASLGATPVAVDPQAHDRLMALTSHLPHVLANVLVNQAGAVRVDGHEPLALSGGSLRDMVRVAGANPSLWVDIFLENADVLRDALAEYRRRVEGIEAALSLRDGGFLARWIAEARANRARMLETQYPASAEVFEVFVRVNDRPGVLAGITNALSAECINIEDFELCQFAPGLGGDLRLLVAGDPQALRAAALLEAQGYTVVGPLALGPAVDDSALTSEPESPRDVSELATSGSGGRRDD